MRFLLDIQLHSISVPQQKVSSVYLDWLCQYCPIAITGSCNKGEDFTMSSVEGCCLAILANEPVILSDFSSNCLKSHKVNGGERSSNAPYSSS